MFCYRCLILSAVTLLVTFCSLLWRSYHEHALQRVSKSCSNRMAQRYVYDDSRLNIVGYWSRLEFWIARCCMFAGSKECSGNPEGGSLPTSAPTSPTSGVGAGAGTGIPPNGNATSLARNPLRGSKCNRSLYLSVSQLTRPRLKQTWTLLGFHLFSLLFASSLHSAVVLDFIWLHCTTAAVILVFSFCLYVLRLGFLLFSLLGVLLAFCVILCEWVSSPCSICYN